jgi:hypothetical protein
MDWHISCPKCGYYGLGKLVLPGSDRTERFLWYLLVLPGFAYRVWRKTNARIGCSQCEWKGAAEPTAE